MSFFIVFLFGLAVGSFLNAFIYRLEVQQGLRLAPQNRTPGVRSTSHPRGVMLGVTEGRSFCPSCGHTLLWYDLIPLLSFVFLKGKCRYCKEKISFQYPFVELACALLFVSIFAKFGLAADNLTGFSFPQALGLLYLWTIASLLMVIFVYDLKHFIIPDKVLFPAIGLVVFWQFLVVPWFSQGVDNLAKPSFAELMLAGLGAASFFFAIFLLSRGRAMGFGDVKLALFMGLFLGWPNILVALAFAFSFGAIVGLVLIFLKKKTMHSEVPFGPFLILGTFVALFWSNPIVYFYLSLLGV